MNGKKHVRLSVTAASAICLVTIGSAAAVKDHIKTIEEGPTVCMTAEAASQTVPPEIMGSSGAYSTDRISCRSVLEAAVALGDAGSGAREAVQVLIQKFPRAIHVEVLNNLNYIAEAGTFEDWLMTKTMATKTRMELNPPFGALKLIDPCSEFIEAKQEHELFNAVRSGGRLVSATVSLKVYFVIYAGACALSRITGMNLGTDRARWMEHYGPAAAYSTAPPPQIHTPPPPPVQQPRYVEVQPSTPVAATQAMNYTEALKQSPVGSKVTVTLFNGSVLIGQLVSMDGSVMRLDIPGMSPVSVKREAVREVVLNSYR